MSACAAKHSTGQHRQGVVHSNLFLVHQRLESQNVMGVFFFNMSSVQIGSQIEVQILLLTVTR